MIFYENKSSHLYCWQGNDLTFPPHIHKELEILLVKKGEIELTVNSKQQVLHEGDIGFTFPNTIHGYKTLTKCQYFIIIFNGDILPLHKNVFAACKPAECRLPASKISKEVYSCLNNIFRETQSGNNPGIIAGYLYLAVTRLISYLTLQKINKEVSGDLIEKILGYIQLNYLSPISLNSIAAELSISPYYLSRVFSNSIGFRLDTYINELRVNYANHLLLSTNKGITEIALDSGFETLRTFNRAYKSITSFTPREFRKQQIVLSKK